MLIMHKEKDGCKATIKDVMKVKPGKPEGRWQPVSHKELIGMLEKQLKASKLKVTEKEFGLCRDGNWLFGVYAIAPTKKQKSGGYTGMIGLRNDSGLKKLSAAVCFGSKVFVCDNMAFTGESVLSTMHTVNVYDRLPGLIEQAVGSYAKRMQDQDKFFSALKAINIADTKSNTVRAADLILDGVRNKIVPSQAIDPIIQHWDNPPHKSFKPRTAWSLYNAYTDVLKNQFATHTIRGADKTIALTNMFRERLNIK